jgi:hypothetical protein
VKVIVLAPFHLTLCTIPATQISEAILVPLIYKKTLIISLLENVEVSEYVLEILKYSKFYFTYFFLYGHETRVSPPTGRK